MRPRFNATAVLRRPLHLQFHIETLQGAGYEVPRLRDFLPVESKDSVVIAKAQELNAILLSLNGDFADIVTYPPPRFNGIVALQMRNHPETLPHLLDRLLTYLKLQPDMRHYRGKLLVVEADRIRIRQ